ncbi:MAG: UDP-N-acetylmuramate--L-alanine ligase [Patescibacteria group bacterium]
MKKIKNIHFVGIKGVGMTPLAIVAKEAGFEVTGSDINEEFITDKALQKVNIAPLVGFSRSNIDESDLVITTGAHGGFDNPEVLEAKERNIPVWTQGQAVGEFMKGDVFGKNFMGISIAGSHGKTTTAAMIATILKDGNLDPSYIIGTSEIASLGLPGHLGKGKYFIAEADEYATEPQYDKTPKFLWQHPEILVITNIELDHPDLFENVEILRRDFLSFANANPKKLLIICGDDGENKKLINDFSGNKITYGFSPTNDYSIEKFKEDNRESFFWVNSRGTSLGEFVLNLPGEFNALNALASVIAGIETGLSIEKVKAGIKNYKGAKRRFEYIGRLASGALLFDDYAHHPTEIRKTLKAFHENYNNKKIVCIFQPHTYSRTKALFDDFLKAFSNADAVVVSDIYPSLREEKDESVSSKILVNKMSAYHNNVEYLPSVRDVVEYISENQFDDNYVIITMGAGDIYKINEKLITKI